MDRHGRPSTAIRSAIGISLAGLSIGSAHANFVNGGFEQGLQGWSVSNFFSEGFDYGIDNYAQAGSSAFFGGGIGDAGVLSQTVATTAGQSYVLSFWLSGDGYMPNEFTVLANDAPLFQLTDAALVNQTYQQVKLFLNPASASTTFSFAFRSDSGAFHIDNLSVTAVPEPSSALLLAVGAGALAALRKARRARSIDQ